MNVLIVEDEVLLSRRLKELLIEINPGINISGITASVHETLQWLSANTLPDLIFMDIELGDGKSFDIFRQTNIDVPVIFTTAYDEFALQAFKVNSIDYLLKPLKKTDLQAAIEKYKKLSLKKEVITRDTFQNLLKMISPAKNFKERFLVKKQQKMISVETADIAYFTIHNTLNYLVTKDKQRYITDYVMDDLEQMLDPSLFFRANRQFIISRAVVTVIHPWFNSKLKVEISQPVDEDIVISRDKAREFKEWMGE